MIELERTFLARYIPCDIKKYISKEIYDIYIPKTDVHPKLRVRKNGNKFEITKKQPIENDFSRLKEETIILNEKEFEVLKNIDGKKIRKTRYNYKWKENIAEIDIFLDNFLGLVLIDFEFSSIEEKNNFLASDFCLVEVTYDDFVAGGNLCGKKYSDIEDKLNEYGYKKLYLNNTDLLDHGVVAIIIKENKYLLLKEAREQMKDYWGPPHGRCDIIDESEEDSVIREVFEETNLKIKPIKKLWTTNADLKTKTISFWSTEYISGNIDIDKTESSLYGWFSLDEALRLDLYPKTKIFFEMVKNGIIKI